MSGAKLIWEAYTELISQVQSAFRRVDREYPGLIGCALGCDDCCSAPFRLSLIEAVAVRSATEALDRKARRQIAHRAAKSLDKSEALFGDLPSDLREAALAVAGKRLRCPLLTERGCAVYPARPATCRLYGIPTQSRGQSHTCPKSGFEKGESYPTVNLDRVADRLAELSLDLAKAGGLSGLDLAPRTVSRAVLEEFRPEICPG